MALSLRRLERTVALDHPNFASPHSTDHAALLGPSAAAESPSHGTHCIEPSNPERRSKSTRGPRFPSWDDVAVPSFETLFFPYPGPVTDAGVWGSGGQGSEDGLNSAQG
ncbi:hypothetical protein G7046_g5998 [Stylonectria norvegica]|nr:hypothetical protein G7046_g5998 [Stylonectria norvegica]